jgi:ABC-type Fe3+/spermidine/putrescine transport system ATPase subunit
MTDNHGASIEIKASKTFGKKARVLDSVCFTIEPGETFVILGPSGSGKTTLLRILAGLETADSGSSIRVDGAEMAGSPAEKRGFGMVFQRYALFPHMNVANNIAYSLMVRKVPRQERIERVQQLLSMVDLVGFADRRVQTLSGGQLQRVAIARAIAYSPRVLLLDEPMTALDAKLKEKLRIELHSLLRKIGITTVLVTHDQSEALSLADRILVLDGGKVCQIGTPQDVYYKPKDRFTATFIGTTNVLSGERIGDEFVAGRIRLAIPKAVDGLAPSGQESTSLFFRPEDVRFTKPGHGDFDAVVEAVLFMGERSRIALQAESQGFVCDIVTRDAPNEGETVGVLLNVRSVG